MGVTFECDYPEEARTPTDRLDQRDARGTDAGRDRRVRGGGDGQRRRPLPPRRGCAGRSRRRPGRHPGPVRGLRGRRLRRGRRAGPPRLHGRGADHRPAHARRRLRLDRDAGQGHRPRGGGDRPGAATSGGSWPRCGAAVSAAAAAGDVPGVDRPAVRPRSLDPGDDRARRRDPAARHRRREVTRASRGTTCTRPQPDVVVVAPCGYDREGSQCARRRPGGERRAAGRRTGPRRRRQRVLGPARHPAGRRRRGAGQAPAPPTRS